jgi:hypothetical protein
MAGDCTLTKVSLDIMMLLKGDADDIVGAAGVVNHQQIDFINRTDRFVTGLLVNPYAFAVAVESIKMTSADRSVEGECGRRDHGA